jgi:Sulfatase
VRWALAAIAAALLGAGLLAAALHDDAPARGGRPSVVIVVFDEFPVDFLRRPDGRIDARRFPGFARLAGTSTWYVNAQASHDSTPKAVPAILDARLPRPGPRATAQGHPDSVFTLLGAHGYRVVASEEATDLCPERLCPGAARRRKPTGANIARGRQGRLERWIASIRAGGKPALYFKHALLPHIPWVFVPSGHHLPLTPERLPAPQPLGEQTLLRANEQRLLLQIGFVDRELRLLLGRLRRTGLLRRALIVVTADHGLAFELRSRDRRKVTPSNIDEVAPVPLFVKAPGQRRGRVDRTLVRALDVLPTVARLLGLRIPWSHEGRPAGALSDDRAVRMPTRSFTRTISIGLAAFDRRRRENIARRTRLFGTGSWLSVYRAGPHPELFGARLAAAARLRDPRVSAVLDDPGRWRDVDLRARTLPLEVWGHVTRGRPGERRTVAVALNGRVCGLQRTYALHGVESFAVIVPDRCLRQGRNAVSVVPLRSSRAGA